MTRGRKRKRYQTLRKSTDENDHSQSGQGEEIANPPAQHTSPRRGTEMKSSNPLQTEESGIGNDIYYAAHAVSPNANHQVQRVPLFTVTALPNQYLMMHRYWRINNLRIQRANNNLFNVLHLFGTETYVFLLDDSKNIAYSDEAHLSAVKAAIQYSETLLQNEDDFPPDFESSDEEDDYSRLQNPTKTPIISKDFL
jgi:hypothetical protein